MKKFIFVMSAAVFSLSSFAQSKADDIAKFRTEVIDQGKLQIETPMTATFTVTNVGSKDLLIESASPTCGCTIGDYTKTPIKPGQSGEITATYNAKALGSYEKHMNVKFAGADDMKSITLKGEVLSADDYVKYKAGTKATNASAATSIKPAARTTSKKAVVKRTTKTSTVKAS